MIARSEPFFECGVSCFPALISPPPPWCNPPSIPQKKSRRFRYTRSILPTGRIFQAGFNLAGACALPATWTTCGQHGKHGSGGGTAAAATQAETTKIQRLQQRLGYASSWHGHLCVRDDPKRQSRAREGGRTVDFRFAQDFDETVTEKDAYALDPETEGVLYHFQIYRDDITASEESLHNVSVYSHRYFPNVLRDLRKRGLDLIVTIHDPPPDVPEVAGADAKVKVSGGHFLSPFILTVCLLPLTCHACILPALPVSPPPFRASHCVG